MLLVAIIYCYEIQSITLIRHPTANKLASVNNQFLRGLSVASATWYMHTKVSLLASADTHTPITCGHQVRQDAMQSSC
jgi:hypothetical protein